MNPNLKALIVHDNLSGTSVLSVGINPSNLVDLSHKDGTGIEAIANVLPQNNGRFRHEAQLWPHADVLTYSLATQGYRAEVDAAGIRVYDADNTIIYQVP